MRFAERVELAAHFDQGNQACTERTGARSAELFAVNQPFGVQSLYACGAAGRRRQTRFAGAHLEYRIVPSFAGRPATRARSQRALVRESAFHAVRASHRVVPIARIACWRAAISALGGGLRNGPANRARASLARFAGFAAPEARHRGAGAVQATCAILGFVFEVCGCVFAGHVVTGSTQRLR
jgi:hypothetical protein